MMKMKTVKGDIYATNWSGHWLNVNPHFAGNFCFSFVFAVVFVLVFVALGISLYMSLFSRKKLRTDVAHSWQKWQKVF